MATGNDMLKIIARNWAYSWLSQEAPGQDISEKSWPEAENVTRSLFQQICLICWKNKIIIIWIFYKNSKKKFVWSWFLNSNSSFDASIWFNRILSQAFIGLFPRNSKQFPRFLPVFMWLGKQLIAFINKYLRNTLGKNIAKSIE